MQYENVEVNSKRWFSLENLLNEEWRDIKDYEGIYQISNYGRIKSLQRKLNCNIKNVTQRIKKEQILKNTISKTGYYKTNLTFNSKSKNYKIHRLISIYFIPNPNNYPIINHKDGNKLNNYIDNLEWCTYSQNNKHAFKMGLKKAPIKYGKENGFSKVVYMICPKTNKIIKKFDCLADAGRFLNKNPKSMSHISQQAKGERITAYGYKWRYENDITS